MRGNFFCELKLILTFVFLILTVVFWSLFFSQKYVINVVNHKYFETESTSRRKLVVMSV